MKLVRRISSTLRKRRRHPGPAVMSGGSAGGGAVYVQYFVGHYHGPDLKLVDFMLLAAVIAAAALGVEILARLVPRVRRTVLARRERRRRVIADAGVERRARALMSELCPHGWRAQITLFGPGEAVPDDAPGDGRARVALDWAELEDESGRAAVVRRVWAPTIAAALDAMVADRRTDETLEQIERGAQPDDAPWPDMYL